MKGTPLRSRANSLFPHKPHGKLSALIKIAILTRARKIQKNNSKKAEIAIFAFSPNLPKGFWEEGEAARSIKCVPLKYRAAREKTPLRAAHGGVSLKSRLFLSSVRKKKCELRVTSCCKIAVSMLHHVAKWPEGVDFPKKYATMKA